MEKAGQIIDAMRASPPLLAIMILQLATLGMIYVISSANAERVQARELALIEACQEDRT
jgi:hypothetical protein